MHVMTTSSAIPAWSKPRSEHIEPRPRQNATNITMAQLEEMEAPQEGSSGEPRYFQFVDVIAGPTVKTKADQRRVVRSNAARYQWSQTKSNSKTATKASKKTTKKATNTVSRGYELENVSKELQVTRLTLLDKSASLSTAMLSLPGEDDCNLLKFSMYVSLPFHQLFLIPYRLRHHSPLSPPTPPQRHREPSRHKMGPARSFQPNSLPNMDEMRCYPPQDPARRITLKFYQACAL